MNNSDIVQTHMTEDKFLHQIDVARRWNLSPKTLEKWRYLKKGVPFFKIGGSVRYSLEDVISYEREQKQIQEEDI